MPENQERVWLVDRTVTEKPSLIAHIYATTDGGRYRLIEKSSGGSTSTPATRAGLDVPADQLAPVDDEEIQSMYAAEASRMASRHDPDDRI